jgi:hypothetical protein
LSLIRKHGLLHGSIGAFAEVCRTLPNETGRATRPGHRATSVPLYPLESALPPRPTPFTAPRAEPCSAARALHALLVVSDLRAVAPTVRPPPARRAKVELGQQRTRSACCSASSPATSCPTSLLQMYSERGTPTTCSTKWRGWTRSLGTARCTAACGMDTLSGSFARWRALVGPQWVCTPWG